MEHIIEEKDKGTRLDVYVQKIYSDRTRSFIKNLIEKGDITVNGESVKAGFSLRAGDIVDVEVPEPISTDISPENIPLDIVYEDSDLLVINKPQGMVVHPASGCYTGTLVNALLYHIKDLSGINGELRPGIVHRLDKDTAGLLLVAKNDFAHVSLAEQIKEKSCKRIYKAIVLGYLKEKEGQITTYLNRGTNERKKIFVVPIGRGKIAITNYKVLEEFKGYSLVEYELKTGRTHQIRVHSAFIGHPILGDKVYGKPDDRWGLVGQALCACKISFTHPRTGEAMTFEVPLPDWFNKVLDDLK